MAARSPPISPDEADHAFAGLAAYQRIVIAVSGGADSLALMHLLADWHARQSMPPSLLVVTVDHRLRPDSADEAARVAIWTAGRGLAHVPLRDDTLPPATPFSQAWARDLRYRLLLRAALDGLETKRLLGGTLGSHPAYPKAAIVTAHHLDDQTETVIMRLARGSGLDGLGGIRAVRPLHARADLVRPLLAFPKARLVATLRTRGHDWIQDPSNENPRFERVRVRAQADALAVVGIDSDAVGRSARRLARADAAVETAVDDVFDQGDDKHKPIQLSHAGYARIDWDLFSKATPEVRLRALTRLLTGLGDAASPVSLGQLEVLTEDRGWPLPDGLTLHSCRFIADEQIIFICPEAGRLADVRINPLGSVRWGPFQIEPTTDLGRRTTVRPIGAAHLAALTRAGHVFPDWTKAVPRGVIEVQPAIFTGDNQLKSAPTLLVDQWSVAVTLPLTWTAKPIL